MKITKIGRNPRKGAYTFQRYEVVANGKTYNVTQYWDTNTPAEARARQSSCIVENHGSKSAEIGSDLRDKSRDGYTVEEFMKAYLK